MTPLTPLVLRGFTQHQLPLRHAFSIHFGFDLELEEIAHHGNFLRAQENSFIRSYRSEEFHAANRGKKKKRFGVVRITGSAGNAGRLGESLSKDHTRHEWIIREMTDKHRIILLEGGRTLGRNTGIAADYFPHENEWGPMRQTESADVSDALVDGMKHEQTSNAQR